MKLCKPAKQLTAALVAGAMALSLCAPALAEAPLPGAAAAVAAPTESTPDRKGSLNGSATYQDEEGNVENTENWNITVNGMPVTKDNCNNILGGANNGKLSYDSQNKVLKSEQAIYGNLTITAPEDVDIQLCNDVGAAAPGAVYGVLTVIGGKDITVRGRKGESGAPCITDGVDIQNCAGNIEITADDYLAVSNSLNVKNCAGSVTIKNNGISSTVACGGSIECKGEVTIVNNAGMAVSTYNQGLTIKNKADIKITGCTENSPAIFSKGVVIETSGNVVIGNAGVSGMAVSGPLKVDTTGTLEITGTTKSSPIVSCNKDEVIELTASEIKVESLTGGALNGGEVKLTTTTGDLTVTGGGTYMPAVCGDIIIDCSGDVKITGAGHAATNGNLTIEKARDVTISGKNFATLNGEANRDGTMKSGNVEINCTGLLKITNTQCGAIAAGDLTVRSASGVELATECYNTALQGVTTIDTAGDVVINVPNGITAKELIVNSARKVTLSNANSYPTVLTAKVTCSGDVKITGSNYMAVGDKLTVLDAQNVEISGAGSVSAANDAEITCDGDVKIISSGYMAVRDLTVHKAQSVTLSGAGSVPCVGNEADITASSDVTVSTTSEKGIGRVKFTQAEERNYVLKLGANMADAAEADHAKLDTNVEESYLSITPTEYKVVVVTDPAKTGEADGTILWAAADSRVELDAEDYKPDPDVYPGMEFERWEVVSDNAVLNNAESTSTYIEKMPAGKVKVIAHWKGGAAIPEDPMDSGFGQSSSAVGTVMAGVAIGGAAAFVGYKVVTDILLSNLLPEDAAVPVNRGQLAWLIWGAKGAPAPMQQPAFTDVVEPEMALAAQWCVEQGLLTAEDGKFEPDGWTPKWRVIQVWNQAFPKE